MIHLPFDEHDTVLLDCDGVLADFDGVLFEEFGDFLDCTPETQTHRFLTDHITPAAHFISDNTEAAFFRGLMRHAVRRPGFFRDLPVMPGAQEGVEALLRTGAEVLVVTKPLEESATCPSDKFSWLAEHFPDLVGSLFLAPDKSKVVGTVLIDDAIKPQWRLPARWEPVTFDHPWNREGKYANRARFNWTDGYYIAGGLTCSSD